MQRFIQVLLVFYCFIATIYANAQHKESDIITKRLLSVEDGLAAREVLCTVQDKDGFMWFGTSNGLNRYDGKKFTLYNSTNTGLSSNFIVQLAIDDQNNLIIIYRCNEELFTTGIDKRIQVLDLKTYELKSFSKVYPKIPFNVYDIYWISNDETSELNILTKRPVVWWKYNSEKGFEKKYQFKDYAQYDHTPHHIYEVLGKMSIFRKNKASINLPLNRKYLVTEDTAFFYYDQPSMFVKDLNKDQRKDYLRSLNQINQWFTNLPTESNKVNTGFIDLTQYRINVCVNESSSLFENENGGIYISKDQIFRLLYTADELKGFFEFGINKNYVDRLGNLWICSSIGVMELTNKQNHFTHCFEHSTKSLHTAANQTRGIYLAEGERGDTCLYANVSTDMLIRSRQKETLIKGNNGLFFAMLPDQDGLYIGADILLKYLPSSQSLKKVDTIAGTEIWSLFKITDNKLLLGRRNGIYSYDAKTGRTEQLLYGSIDIPRVKNVYRILRSPFKGIIAVAENGIYVIDNRMRIVDYYGKETANKSKYVSIDTIYDLLEDKLGVCWIATGGAGLYKWKWNEPVTTHGKNIQQFSLIDGFPSSILYRIEQDDDGYLWIGTYNGLVRFDTYQNTCLVFTSKDGLSANEFNRVSSFKAKNGDLYFGSMNGVNAFTPKAINKEIASLIIPFRLISLSKFWAGGNRLKDCLPEFKQQQKIVMEAGDKFLSVDFALLDYQQRIHPYAYRIEGFDSAWTYLEEGSLRISGLPAGEYTLRIKATLENGQWNKNEITIPISVLKAIYLRWWFLAGCIILTMCLFFLFYYYRTRKLASDKIFLENAVLNRTKDLQKALGDKDLLLAEIHHRVKNNLQVISGLLQLQGATVDNDFIKNAIHEGQSRVNSIALIHENLYQHESLERICFNIFIKDMVSKVAELFANGNQFIRFDLGEEEVLLDIDTAVPLGLIVNELVTNAYKYLPRNNSQNIVCISLTILQDGYYRLLYKDNGPGIKGGTDFNTANSLGLKLIKGLSAQLHGTANYRYDVGAEITIVFKNK